MLFAHHEAFKKHIRKCFDWARAHPIPAGDVGRDMSPEELAAIVNREADEAENQRRSKQEEADRRQAEAERRAERARLEAEEREREKLEAEFTVLTKRASPGRRLLL